MNLEEAIKILKREGYTVAPEENLGDKRTQHYIVDRGFSLPDGKPFLYTATELIKWARHYTSEDGRNSTMKGHIKKYDHIKDRRATKKAIKEERWDDIPLNGKVKEENPWNWD